MYSALLKVLKVADDTRSQKIVQPFQGIVCEGDCLSIMDLEWCVTFICQFVKEKAIQDVK